MSPFAAGTPQILLIQPNHFGVLVGRADLLDLVDRINPLLTLGRIAAPYTAGCAAAAHTAARTSHHFNKVVWARSVADHFDDLGNIGTFVNHCNANVAEVAETNRRFFDELHAAHRRERRHWTRILILDRRHRAYRRLHHAAG